MDTRKRTKTHARPYGGGSLIKRSNGVYYAVFTVGRGRRWISLGTRDAGEAETAFARLSSAYLAIRENRALEALARHAAASADDRPAGEPTRLDALWARFAADPNRPDCGERNMDNYRHLLQHLVRWMAAAHPEAVMARDLTQSMADAYVEERRRTVSGSTVNKSLNCLALVWRVLARPCGLAYNPWSDEHVIRRKAKAAVRRTLTDAERARLVAEADGELKLLMALGSGTPLRLGDLVSLRWDEVHLGDGVIAKRTSKTGAFVVCPIGKALRDALREAETARHGDSVLPGLSSLADMGSVTRRVSAHFRACGVERVAAEGIADFHSFRHTWITRMVAAGVNPAAVQRAAGHASIAMTGRYTHLDAETVKAAFKGLEG